MHEGAPGFFRSLVGLLVEPAQTASELLSSSRPPHVFPIVLLMLATIFVPLLFHIDQPHVLGYELPLMASLAVFLSLCLLFFIALEAFMLAVLGELLPPRQLLACAVYSVTPLLVAVWVYYLFGYLSGTGLGFLDAFLSGRYARNESYMQALPFILLLAHFVVIAVFFCCIRYLTEMHPVSALFVTVLSLVPFYGAVILSLRLSDALLPGAAAAVHALFLTIELPLDLQTLLPGR